MIKVGVMTSDSMIWNKEEVFAKISHAIFTNQDLVLDFLNEGPAFENLGIDEFIQKLLCSVEYSSTIEVITCNMMQTHASHRVVKKFPYHLLEKTFAYHRRISKNNNLKHFGLFVGRGNSPRLYLSTYLQQNYPDLILHTNHFDLNDDFHAANIGLDRLVLEFGVTKLAAIADYMKTCPITENSIIVDKSLEDNHAQQLLKNDKEVFLEKYNNFAVEVVAETYFSGCTFFPTEKTWRPILLKTPFIIQGPTGYLDNLKKLGFKTFNDYWDEGYDEDGYPWSVGVITDVIDTLASYSQSKIHDMIVDMQFILDHNYNRLIELSHDIK